MKNIILLGASGSIGEQTLDVLSQHQTRFKLVGASVGRRIAIVHRLIKEYSCKHIYVQLEQDAQTLKETYPNVHFYFGETGLQRLASLRDGEMVVNALVGFVGLAPTIEAIKCRKDIALANKETLVVAGDYVMELAKKYNVKILPVDSEHSAIYQCLLGNQKNEVKNIIITASGGSFRDLTREQLVNVKKEDALNHPNWSMGAKITIDSATMMNKGLEVIEAHHLFQLPYEQIKVIMHRQSIVHSMVEYIDHSIIAQLGSSDMRHPIQFALSYPLRIELQTQPLDFTNVNQLTFEELSFDRFPMLALAYKVGEAKGNLPSIMNAANEVAVQLFLDDKISFLEIERLVSLACTTCEYIKEATIEQIIQSDKEARAFVLQQIKE